MKAVIVILRGLLTLLIISLLVVNLTLMVSVSAGDGMLPQILENYIVVIKGSDMEPALHHNDVVIVHKQPEYKMGQVVAFKAPPDLTIHRIVGTHGIGYITQGDARPQTDDSLLNYEDVMGEVVFCIPSFGTIYNWMLTPIFTAALVLLFVLLIIVPSRLDRRNSY